VIKNKDLRLYEELAHRVAMDAAERRELTSELREVSRRLHAWVHERLDAMDRMDAVSRAAARRRRYKRPRQ
jgi:hypothetical protein